MAISPFTKFDLNFYITGNDKALSATGIIFDNCFTVGDVRLWINKSQDFINIGDHIINKRNISHIYITETKEV